MSRRVLLALTVLFAGCRLDAEGLATVDPLSDGAPPITADAGDDSLPLFPVEDAVAPECEEKADGTRCTGSNHICIGGACLPSTCGDGVVTAGEDCDDGNTTPGDACPENCKYECSADANCDDGNTCSVDKCDIAKHVCAAKTPVTKGTLCKLSSGENGFCNGTSCTSATCGDKFRQDPEQCDDGNTVDTDGCKSDCTFTCTKDADCSDGDFCTGVETCNTTTHVCVRPPAVTCNDSLACTRDSCSSSTGMCAYTKLDVDGDGFSFGMCGDDCNDRNRDVRPDAGFFPTSYTTLSGTRSFDYNCDGVVSQRFPNNGSCVKDGSNCIHNRGWIGTIPACGATGAYLQSCDPAGCKEITAPGVQECR